jgi:threonine/homoserine/homoserine lactone efflux protein
MITILFGLALGFVSAIPSGPVGVNVISATLKASRRYAISLGIGSSLIDMIYMFLGLTGISLITFSDTMLYWIQICGILVLLALGWKEINYKAIDSSKATLVQPKRRRYLILGSLLTVTNPMIFFSFAAIATIVRSFDVFAATRTNDFIFSFCVGLGAIGWFSVLSVITHGFKHKVTSDILRRISVVSGWLLIACAAYLILNLVFQII